LRAAGFDVSCNPLLFKGQAAMSYATDYTTLLTGSYWTGAQVTGEPVILTYSFLATKPTSDPHGLGATTLNTFTPFTAAQQTQTQQALADWSSKSGIIFEQVAPGQGDINFAAYDLTAGTDGAGGEGFYPWGNWNYSTETATTINFAADIQANGYGDVLMNTADETGGLFAYPTLLHEIGHALGLKHPTEAWTLYPFGTVYNQWDPSVTYNPNFSIMSPGGSGSTLTDLTGDDVLAIQSIYGAPSQKAAQFASWSWNPTTYTLTGTLKNGGQTVRGVSTSNTITGGSGADVIYAIGQGVNYIYGKAGNDTLVGGSGLNYLDGGAGADTLNGWFSANTYATYTDAPSTGGVGVTVNLLNPSLNTGDAAGDVYVDVHKAIGSNYADTITADNSGDILYGGAGDDRLTGGTGTDRLYGQAGNDTLIAGPGTSYLDGGAGGDTLIGSAGHASYAAYSDAATGVTVNLLAPSSNTGDAAGDTYTNIHDVLGSNYADTITADNSGDILDGGAGDDTLTGGTGTDYLYGQAGNDTLIAGPGFSFLDGGAGADKLIGSAGHASFASYSDATAGVTVNLLSPSSNTGDAAGDSYTNIHNVLGSNYADAITGDNSGDTLNGGAGADTIVGGSGRDVLIGGAGADRLTGGLGADQFRYYAPSEGGDTITDFSAAQGDTISVSHAGFGGGLVAGPLDPSHFTAGATSGAAGQFVWSAATHQLSWDADGAGPGTATLIATLTGVTTLTAANIQVF
jgi:Ca2+-binding RTX toxin-like protein